MNLQKSVNIKTVFNLLDIPTLKHLEQDVSEQTESSVLDDSERYNVFIAVEKNGDFHFMNLMSKIQLTKQDEQLLKEWLNTEEHLYYMNDYFRVDLENYICLIKIYRYEKTNENMVLYGFAVNNTAWDKMTLQMQRQKYINGLI